MPGPLNQLLAEGAARLVHENFAGVRAEWWWERRLGGGLAVCQELDPETMARELARRTGRPESETRSATEEELGLEDFEPVVLTFEIPGDATTEEAASLLRERSAAPEGLAASLYRKVTETLAGQ